MRHRLEGALASEYDQFVDTARGGHYMQTRAYGDVASVGKRVERRFLIARSGGRIRGAALALRSRVGFIPSPSIIMERGPVVDSPEDLEEVLTAMVKTLSRHGVLKIRMQPYWSGSDAIVAARALARVGTAGSEDRDGPHTTTLRLDLDMPRAEIFAGSERSFLRNKVKQAEKLGVTTKQLGVEGLTTLANLYNTMMSEQSMEGKPESFFDALAALVRAERATIFQCDHDGAPVGSVLVIRHGEQVTFHLGATSGEKKPFKKMLLPLVRAAEWAHEVGAKRFDLGGVPEEDDKDDKRNAIAQFKFDFSKTRVALLPVQRYSAPLADLLERAPVNEIRNLTSRPLESLGALFGRR